MIIQHFDVAWQEAEVPSDNAYSIHKVGGRGHEAIIAFAFYFVGPAYL